MLAGANVLLILGVILVVGIVFGAMARRLQLPSVTGQIVGGILIGPSVIGVFTEANIHTLDPLIDFALGLMAVAVGSHLNFRRLHVARRRLFLLLAFEATLTPVLVLFGVIAFADTTWVMAILLSAIAVSTAPATVLALVKETASKGAFVTTLLAAVALNNLVCIILFELARTIARTAIAPDAPPLPGGLVMPMTRIGMSLVLGAGVGYLLTLLTRNVVRSDRLAVLSLAAILLTAGITAQVGMSVLFACLCLGISLANFTPDKEEIGHRVFASFESAIFAVFFTVAGMELKFGALALGGVLAAIAFTMRMAGKVAAGYLGMKLAGATDRFRYWLGISLIPQAGLAVGLMLLVTEDTTFDSIRELFLAVVLSMVLLNEIVGPVLTRMGLRRSGDFGRDRARILDFLTERSITTDLKGPDMAAAVRQLVELTMKSHRLSVSSDEVYDAVMGSERVEMYCVGEGLALPHARLDVGDRIVGAMGISRSGLQLETPDDKPVHCMVLIITPTSLPDQHLAVLSSLAASIGRDWNIQQRLYHINSAAHADELLHLDQQFEDWNHYLEEEVE